MAEHEAFELPDAVAIAPSAFVAPNATVVGRVTIAERASVWFNAVVRAEAAEIVIGPESNVQDGAVLHVDEGCPVVLGARVTVGHRAVVHGATVEDDCIIGIGAILLNGATVGAGSIVAAGALLPEGRSYPPGSLLMGAPAKVVRGLRPEEIARIRDGAAHYVAYGAAYAAKVGELL